MNPGYKAYVLLCKGKYVAEISSTPAGTWQIDAPDYMLRSHRDLFMSEEEMADEAWDRYILPAF